jgi:protein-tyrosine kinase
MKPLHGAMPAGEPDDDGHAGDAQRRPIGALIRDARELSDAQIEKVLAYQRKRGLRFGEAAVALRLVDRQEVLEALSRQFDYAGGFAGREGDSELVVAADPFSDQADAFRELRSRLLLEACGEAPRAAIAVVSPEAGDGKTYLAANLAVAFSQLGERVLLMDADIRTPRQQRLLRVRPARGLTSVLAGHAQASAIAQPVPGVANLFVLQAGAVPPNPLELLQRPALGRVVHEMLQSFAHVIVDTPAAVRGADARVIAARCGVALAVARRGRSRMAPLEGLLAALSRGRVSVAGVVMNEH